MVTCYPRAMKLYIFLFFFLSFFALSWAENNTETPATESYIPYRIAVTDFRVDDLSGSLENSQSIANALASAFETALVESERFQVVSRNNLDVVLQEIALSQSGIIRAEQAIEVGKLSGAELLVTGSLSYDEGFSIHVNFINTLTGEIDAAASLQTQNSTGFSKIARELCQQAGKSYAPRGTIIAIGRRTFIDLGSESGVGETRTGTIVREILVEGLRFHEKVGRFTITSLGPEASTINIDLEPTMQVEVGDIAILDSHFSFDIKTINNLNQDSSSYFGTVIIEVIADNIPQNINIFTAEGVLEQVARPFHATQLFQGNYIASPYGADAYDQSPAIAFSIQAGSEEVVVLDLSGGGWLEHTNYIEALSYDATGAMLVTGARDMQVIIRDGTTGQGQRGLDLYEAEALMVDALALSQDGHYLATSVRVPGEDARVNIWDLASLEPILNVPHIFQTTALSFNADASILYAVDGWDEIFYQIAVPSGDVLLEQAIEQPDILSFNDAIFLTAEDNTVTIYNLETGQLRDTLQLEANVDSTSLALHAAQGYFAVGDTNATVHLYDFAGNSLAQFRRGKGEVVALDFDSTGTRLAVAVGREIHVWNVAEGLLEQTFSGHEHFITALDFSPRADVIAAASADKALHIWHVR